MSRRTGRHHRGSGRRPRKPFDRDVLGVCTGRPCAQRTASPPSMTSTPSPLIRRSWRDA